jgi:hypothetical protein
MAQKLEWCGLSCLHCTPERAAVKARGGERERETENERERERERERETERQRDRETERQRDRETERERERERCICSGMLLLQAGTASSHAGWASLP